MRSVFRDGLFEKSVDFQSMLNRIKNRAESAVPVRGDEDRLKYLKLNYQRYLRILKTYRISDDLCDALGSIDREMWWMVITEDWCGDSAQTLPYIARMAECNSKIHLRFFSREENPELMEKHLTNGKRSIPKLISVDEAGDELFEWGPRPEPAAEIFREAQAAGLQKPEIQQRLHTWYFRDGGKTLEEEFRELLQTVNLPLHS